MSYKWQTIFWGIIPAFASTYGSGGFNSGTYDGAAASPTPAPVIAIGPITLPLSLPVTGATLAIAGALLIAAGAGTFVWMRQRRRSARP